MTESITGTRASYIRITDATLKALVSEAAVDKDTPFADIARQLDDAGTDKLLLENPLRSKTAQLCAKEVILAVSHSSVCICCKPSKEEILSCASLLKAAKKPLVGIEIKSTSSDKEVNEAVDTAIKAGLGVTALFNISESAQATASRINKVAKIGADSVLLFFSEPMMLPEEVEQYMKDVLSRVEKIGISIGVCCTDAASFALSNTLASIGAGASEAVCTAGKMGITRAESLIAVFEGRREYLGLVCSPKSTDMQKIADFIRRSTGIDNASTAFELRSPEKFRIAGRPALARRAVSLGYSIDDTTLNKVYSSLRNLTTNYPDITDNDICAMIADASALGRYSLSSYQVQSGNGILSLAAISILDTKDGKILDGSAACKTGAIGAVFNALSSLFGFSDDPVTSVSLSDVSEGSNAICEAKVTLSIDDIDFLGRAFAKDSVCAAAKAYIAAINKTYISIK